MNKHYINTVYVLNIVFQAIFTLVIYIGGVILLGYLATTFWGADDWIYIPLILLGVLLGFISMVKFVLVAAKSLEVLEKQQRKDAKARRDKESAEDSTSTNETKEME